MGNESSISSASISIATDKLQYIAGETIEGYVEVEVTDTTSASDLWVIFEGKARTKVGWDDHVGEGEDRHTERRHERAKADITSKEIKVATFPDGEIQPGTYQFKFLLELPEDLPGSCHVARRDHAAEISYGLKVKMNRPGVLKKNLVARAVVDLDSKAPEMKENFKVEDESQVNTLCCINNGSMKLECQVPKNILNAGEEMDVQVMLANDSTKEVDEIRLEVMEQVFISARGHNETIEEVMMKHEEGGCAAGSESSFAATFAMPPAERMRESSPLDFSGGDSCMVRVRHTLVIIAKTGFCISNPSVEIPIYGRRMGQVTLSDEELEQVKADKEVAKQEGGEESDSDDEEGVVAAVPVQAAPVAYAPNTAYASPYQVESAYTPGQAW